MYNRDIVTNNKERKKMELSKGDKIESNKMVMVITGESKDSYLGYHEYKGNPVGQCSILKTTLSNPHYSKGIKLLK